MPRKRNVTGGVQLRFTPLDQLPPPPWSAVLRHVLVELRELDPDEWKEWYDENVAPLSSDEEKATLVIRENIRLRTANAIRELMELDPDGWEAWYDDDNNVPAFGPEDERLRILEARVKELRDGSE